MQSENSGQPAYTRKADQSLLDIGLAINIFFFKRILKARNLMYNADADLRTSEHILRTRQNAFTQHNPSSAK